MSHLTTTTLYYSTNRATFLFAFFRPADYFSFIKGFRGSRKLKVGAYTFTKNKIAMTRTYWSCARAGLHKCKARVVTVNKDDHQQVFIKNNEHNHDPF